MSCYHPIRAYRSASGNIVFDEKKRHGDLVQQLDLPCGKCIACRMQKSAMWGIRIMHEAQLHAENSFITLTYGTGNLPPNSSLEHRDFQLFIKRLRAKLNKPLRFYMCGEYGDIGGRPHYHACIFNHAFEKNKDAGKSGSGEQMYESDELTETWGMGRSITQDLTTASANYCARYILKKTLGQDAEYAYSITTEDGEILHRKPPYNKSSLKPGIGKQWLDKHGKTDIFSHDFVIQDGTKKPIPPYYKKLQKRNNGGEIPERTDILRQERAMQMDRKDNLPDRLKVKEEVHHAKIRNLKRTLE
ncbi:MAG: replication initiator protein [Arizlama microvirus]|nr:MAG: replication initiator protein [Arizlama microvirus]